MHRRDADFLTRGGLSFLDRTFLTVRSGIVCSKNTISRFYQTIVIACTITACLLNGIKRGLRQMAKPPLHNN